MSPWTFVLVACTSSPGAAVDAPSDGEGSAETAGTLVHVAKAETRAMHELVTAPGRTAVLREVHVRAPFAGTLASLTVVAGTAVHAHQVVAVLHSSEAVAAEAGARALRAKAKTDSEIAEAERAVALAASSDVTWPLEAPEAGVVLELAAGPGDRLSEDDDVLTLSPSDALYFRADMSQRDLLRVRIGQHASIRLQSRED
jgi:multidrug resistance efflux pump